MRALGYFTVDPDAGSAPAAGLRSLSQRFDAYCTEGRHIAAGVFAETLGGGARPRWDAMVSQIEQSGLGYLVVVPSAAHLGASLEERIDRVLVLDALACKVVCDDPDVPDPLQNAMRAERGPDSRGGRIREGMLAKAARGLGLGKPPYGYILHVDGVLRPTEAEAEIVRFMFETYAEGNGGVRTIAQALNDRGSRTKADRRWSMVTVRDILRNTAYIGTYRRFGLRVPATHEPIVAPQLFRQVQDLMQSRTPARTYTKGDPYLLTGLLYCGHCGERMMGVTRRQTWRRKDGERARGEYRYYQCQSRINRNQCQYRTTRAPELEEAVVSAVRALEPAEGEGDAAAQAAWTATKRKETENRLSALSRRYGLLIERAAQGAINLGELRVARVEIVQAREALRERLTQVADGADGARALVESERDKLLYLWDDIDVTEQREALRTLISRVVVTDGQVELVS